MTLANRRKAITAEHLLRQKALDVERLLLGQCCQSCRWWQVRPIGTANIICARTGIALPRQNTCGWWTKRPGFQGGVP